VTRRLRVPEDAGGERLDRFLAGVAEIGSRGAAERLLDEGAVLVDGAAQAKSYRLAGGEEVAFDPPAPVAATVEPEQMELRIAYEDAHLLVVDKPAGVVVHPAPGHATGTLWLSRDGIPMKLAGSFTGQKGKVSNLRWELSHVKIGPQPASLFEAPHGYSKLPPEAVAPLLGLKLKSAPR
jgi:ribosomal 50S subunit-recycling heat shock protein